MIEALPELLGALAQVGLNTTSACGEVTKMSSACPVAGVDADEVCDASRLALEAWRMLAGNSDFSTSADLERKTRFRFPHREWQEGYLPTNS
ncbi:MAG: hypothetical protein ABSG23_00350 [Terriglobales bacterium]|jgi:sulfite reductase beta subunit-like hemoprotein